MDELPFPQYKKGVPKAGLDDITHFLLAICISAVVYFLLQMLLGGGPWSTIITGAAAYGTFKMVAVPLVRYIFNRLPPSYMEHAYQTVMYRGGLAVRADPDPIPLRVK